MMKNNTSNFLGVIPARFNSSRLMGKPLKIIGDKPMIQHVYEKAKIVLENVVVATDDDKIFNSLGYMFSFGSLYVGCSNTSVLFKC